MVAKQPHGNPGELQKFIHRQLNLVDSLDGQWAILKTQGPFVTGLGRVHPVENGFLWHPTLGVPYLPGSSVKGLLRAWAALDPDSQPQSGTIERLLGDANKAGRLCLLDAIPTKSVKLEADIMTPHYANWSEDDPPGDWRSPTPIPFLTTAANTPFFFGVVPRGKHQDQDDLKVLMCWLGLALEHLGAGAKTAVGYGRFKQDEGETEKLQSKMRAEREERKREKRLATLPPIKREIKEILEARQNKNMPEHTAIINEIKKNRWEESDEVEAAKWVRDKMKENKKWKETSQAKRPEKDKDYQLTQIVMGWLSET